MNRYEIYDVEIAGHRRPAVIITRESAIPILSNIAMAPIASTVSRLITEVAVGIDNGLLRDCVVRCDNVATLPKAVLGRYRGSLNTEQIFRLDVALKIALQLER